MDQNRFTIELEKPETPLNLVANLAAVSRKAGRGAMAQAADLLRLRLGPGKIEMDEYYLYGLYDRSRFSAQEVACFAGRRRQSEDAQVVNDPAWYMLGQDKLAAGALLEGLGLPVPRLQAILNRDVDAPGLTVLRTREALAGYLREGITYPFFSKPVGGSFSLGIVGVEGLNVATDRLRLTAGGDVPVDDYVAALFDAYEAGPRYHLQGFMFQ
jgi:glutathione synthase/RimK-type ligase-like ATP-grasp enzyme